LCGRTGKDKRDTDKLVGKKKRTEGKKNLREE